MALDAFGGVGILIQRNWMLLGYGQSGRQHCQREPPQGPTQSTYPDTVILVH
jgi:hypothetical protein